MLAADKRDRWVRAFTADSRGSGSTLKPALAAGQCQQVAIDSVVLQIRARLIRMDNQGQKAGMYARRLRAAMIAVGVLVTCDCVAVTVHTWVDAEGVRHYADAPPAGAQDSHELQIDNSPAAPANDYYSIVNQWNRTRAEKQADAAMQIEKDRAAAAAAPPAPPTYIEQPPRALLYPGASPYGYGFGFDNDNRGGRHHHHHSDDDDDRPPAVAPRPPSHFEGRNPTMVNTPPPPWPSAR